MRDISVSQKQLITKAIFVSLVVHFFFLNILVFCFSIPRGIKKPIFVFLGSILQKQDFLVSGLRYPSTPIPFNTILTAEDSAKIHNVPPGKPDFHRTIAVKGKTLFKNPISDEEQTSLEPLENKLEREFPSSAYIPLRLHTK